MSHRFHRLHRFKATQKELVATLKIETKIGLVRKNYVTYNWSIGENNKAPRVCLGALNLFLRFAERTGFEPANQFCRLHAFQACLFNHSSTSPYL